MKHLRLILLSCLTSHTAIARIWYVDPSISSPLVFADISDAVDTAAAGDTILISGTHFIQFSIDKPLTLYGEGYCTDAGNTTTILGRIDILSDSVNISGFRIEAFQASFPLRIWGPARNITIERCWIEGQVSLSPGAIGNVTFRNNVFRKYADFGSMDVHFAEIDTLIVENNVFDDIYFTSVATSSGWNTVVVKNNLFLNGAPFTTVFDGDCGAVLFDNIFYNANPDGCPSCSYSYNLFWNDLIGFDTLVMGNNNLNHLPPGFLNYSGGSFDVGADYTLSDTSPCIGAGMAGLDLGFGGGYYPYLLCEGPKIPLVTHAELLFNFLDPDTTYYLQFNSRARMDVLHPGTLVSNNDSVLMVEAEYWVDSIPVPGTGTLIELVPADTLGYFGPITIPQLEVGTHMISVRCRDDRGNWGFVHSDPTQLIPLGGELISFPTAVNVYPNPAGDEIRVLPTKGGMKWAFVHLYDARGALVDIRPVQGGGRVVLLALAEGVYNAVLTASDGQQKEAFRFLKSAR